MARVLKEDTSLDEIEAEHLREAGLLEKIAPYEIFAGGIALLAGGGLYFAGGPSGVAFVLGAVLLFLGFSHRLKRKDSLADAGHFRRGAEGEKKVSKVLAEGLPDAYLLLNDVRLVTHREAQCDHLLLGPNGIFVIETKAYGGTLAGGAKDASWTQTTEWDGKTTTRSLTNPVSQNEYHCKVFRDLLAEKGYEIPDLFSMIVFTNPRARLRVDTAGTPLLRPSELPGRILGQSAAHTYDEAYLRGLLRAIGLEGPGRG